MKLNVYNLTWMQDIKTVSNDFFKGITQQQRIAVFVMIGLAVLVVVGVIVALILKGKKKKNELVYVDEAKLVEEEEVNIEPLMNKTTVESIVDEPISNVEPLLELEEEKEEENENPFEIISEETVEEVDVLPNEEEIELTEEEPFQELDLPKPSTDLNKKPLFQPILNIEPEVLVEEEVLEEELMNMTEEDEIKETVDEMLEPTLDVLEPQYVSETINENVLQINDDLNVEPVVEEETLEPILAFEPSDEDIDDAINDLHDLGREDELNQVAESLDAITKQLEEEPIHHSDFMKKQEESSIISYQQLLEKTTVSDEDLFRREFKSQELPEDETEDVSLDINDFIKKSERVGMSATNKIKVDENLKSQIEQIHRLNPEQKRQIEEETERYMEEVNRISDNLKDLNDSFDVQLMLKIEQFRRENKKNNEFLHSLKDFKDKL